MDRLVSTRVSRIPVHYLKSRIPTGTLTALVSAALNKMIHRPIAILLVDASHVFLDHFDSFNARANCEFAAGRNMGNVQMVRGYSSRSTIQLLTCQFQPRWILVNKIFRNANDTIHRCDRSCVRYTGVTNCITY